MITVAYATSNGTATAGSDYTATSGTLTISADEPLEHLMSQYWQIRLDENNETATITLSNASNASISDSTATLTITDDDAAPTLEFNNSSGSDQYLDYRTRWNSDCNISFICASGKTDNC